MFGCIEDIRGYNIIEKIDKEAGWVYNGENYTRNR